MKPIETQIRTKLANRFQPTYLDVINESHMHSVPPGSESHFKVILAASWFEGKRQVQRHQEVYAVLAEELASSVHALALHTYTPEEALTKLELVPPSPECLGGSKHNDA